MSEIHCCKKALVYTFLGLNIFLSLLICFLLSLATYDTIFLDWYQYMYLVLAYIVWLLLFVVYIAKLVLILIGFLPTNYVKLAWMVLNIPASVFFLIAFIFDLVMFDQEEILWDIYIIVFVLVFILFIVFTGFDFFLLNLQIEMSLNNGAAFKKEMFESKNNVVNVNNNIAPASQGKTTQIIEMSEMKKIKDIKFEQNKGEKDMNSQNEKIKEN
jgi:hypothetical protein